MAVPPVVFFTVLSLPTLLGRPLSFYLSLGPWLLAGLAVTSFAMIAPLGSSIMSLSWGLSRVTAGAHKKAFETARKTWSLAAFLNSRRSFLVYLLFVGVIPGAVLEILAYFLAIPPIISSHLFFISMATYLGIIGSASLILYGRALSRLDAGGSEKRRR